MPFLKFSQIEKPVSDILEKNYCTAGCQFKVKASLKDCCSSSDEATIKAVVDAGTTGCVRLRLPKPFGTNAVSINSLEVARNGHIKINSSFNLARKHVPGLALKIKKEIDPSHDFKKFDLTEVANLFNRATAGLVYTGIANTQVEVKTDLMDVQQFKAEAVSVLNDSTIGVKFNALGCPDFNVSHARGSAFVALKASKLAEFCLFGAYTLNKDTKLGAEYHVQEHSLKMGVHHQIDEGWALKAKVDSENAVTALLKHSAGGVSFLTGARFSQAEGKEGWGFGFHCTVE